MIKTNAKDLFFKAVLCHLAYDDKQGAKNALQDYQIDDPNFDSSRENELLMSLIRHIDERARDEFIKTVQGYNRLSPLDRIKGKLVERIMEVYVPDQTQGGGGIGKVAKKLKDIDLTGADDFKDEEVKKPAKKTPLPPANDDDDDEIFVPKKKQPVVPV